MALSNDLISQFVKITRDKQQVTKESTSYGKIVTHGDKQYVQLDGSDLLTPISSTIIVEDGDRVIVTIKDHSAIVTGDLTNPSANNNQVQQIGSKISEFEIIIADKVTTQDLEAINAYIQNITAITGKYTELEAITAEIETLQAKYANLDHVTATDMEVINAEIESLKGKFGEFTSLSAEDLEAINAEFDNLTAYNASFTYVSAEVLEALKTEIKSAEIKYANIDFSNIGEAAIEKLFTDSGIIRDLVMSDGKVTGHLVGVTITGDLIEGNTVKADKLVIQGEDGLYYKLNVNALGEATASSDEKYQNGLDGSIIVAESITAEKIAVDDLVAFGATIGGFNITDHSLYSGVKSSVDNTTQGVYFGDDGKIAIGDSSNYLKFFVDEKGNYKLEIQANSLKLSTGKTVEETIDNIQIGGRNILLNSSFKENTDKWSYTDALNPEIIEFDGKTCFHVEHTYLEKTWVIQQSVLGKLEPNTEYTISGWVRTENIVKGQTNYRIMFYHDGYYDLDGTSTWYGYFSESFPVNTGSWQHISRTFRTDDKLKTATTSRIYVYTRDLIGDVYFYNLKLEKGNKATDWTPAPEDLATSTAVSNAQDTANEAKSTAESNESRLGISEATLQILSDNLSTLVRDKNGASLMTQTDEGWIFSTDTIQTTVDETRNSLNELQTNVGSVNNTVNILQQNLNDLGVLSEYVKIKTYEDEPCIELGEDDSNFKLLITNTRIMFIEGSSNPVLINNQSLTAKKIITDELQQGSFIWAERSSGNLGLTWQSS